MTTSQSNSAGRVNAVARARYLLDLFRMRLRGRGHFSNSRNLARIKEYGTLAARHGIDMKSSQILEIGVGQRPYLGITLAALGYCYTGIDLDEPVYPPSFRKFRAIYRANGFLRLLKTIIRYYLFDRPEYGALFASLGVSASKFKNSRFFVQGDASAVDLAKLLAPCGISHLTGRDAPPSLVVISESAFEHIPEQDLFRILQNLRSFAEGEERRLLILTRPTIFTGICGSHLTEWYHHNVYSIKPKASEPWEHLRQQRFAADTYLNKLSRAQYRILFKRAGFVISAETVETPGLGAEFLQDSALRAELAGFGDDELLSNEVMFELVPRPVNQDIDKHAWAPK